MMCQNIYQDNPKVPKSFQLVLLLSNNKITTTSISLLGVIVLFCRQYDIIKDNEPNNNKDKAKNSSECSTPEHPQGGLLRSNV